MGSKLQNTQQAVNHSYTKGLNKDSDPSVVENGMWTHARNATNNTAEGDLGTLSNEVSNIACAFAGATLGNASSKKNIIGAIYIYSDKWVIFTVAYNSNGLGASIGSEIGLFEEDTCNYRPIVQDTCLNFSKFNLITGSSREKQDCTWQVYWADERLNPDRVLNIGDPKTWPSSDFTWIGSNTYINSVGNTMQWPGVAWKQLCTDSSPSTQTSPGVWLTGHPVAGCITCVDTTELDCDAIRLARLMDPPCVTTSLSVGAGTLRNGSYAACIAYSIQGQKVTDYFSISNQQPVYSDEDLQGSIEINITADSVNFDEFILVVIQTINQGTVAKRIGIYSTKTTSISLDQIKEDLITVPIELIPLQSPAYEKSDQIIEVNNYLLRVGPQSKFDFNYQPLANLIETEWVSVQYPANYYVNGGSNTSYLRDEVYAFFIRWIYDTGDKSASYHIPGRAPGKFNVPGGLSNVDENATYANSDNNILPGNDKLFQVYNTASVTNTTQTLLDDGGLIVGKGKMGYWESTEIYPDNQDFIWNSSANCWTGKTLPSMAYDLCGLPIRHHKFPDNGLNPSTNHFTSGGGFIRLMSVDFKNIIYPKDNEGNDIPGIIGYEILRGSREGNKSIVAKGMLNNYRPYEVKGSISGKKGLYANHPFNTIQPSNMFSLYNDPYFNITNANNNSILYTTNPIPKEIVSFHSPDTNFRHPFLSVSELKLYGFLKGTATEQFIEPNKHPKAKLISNLALGAMIIGGVIEAIISLQGETNTTTDAGGFQSSYTAVLANGSTVPLPLPGYETTAIQSAAYIASLAAFEVSLNTYFATGASIPDSLTGGLGLMNLFAASGGVMGNNVKGPTLTSTSGSAQLVGIAPALSQILYYFSEGADVTAKIIYALLPYRQYALQMIAHGFYDSFSSYTGNLSFITKRFNIEDSFYLKDSIQDMSNSVYRFNNLKRSTNVTIKTSSGITRSVDGPAFILGAEADDSLVTIGTAAPSNVNYTDKKTNPFGRQISSHYAGIKVQIDNQYGQMDSIKQIPATSCEQKLSDSGIQEVQLGVLCSNVINGILTQYQLKQKIIGQTPVIFGGDTYINRYTEKNTMFMFYDWLYGQPDDFSFNYKLHQMISEPRFWMNSERYEVTDLWTGGLQGLINNISNTPGTGTTPKRFYNLDNVNYDYFINQPNNYPGTFGVKESYFYLTTSGVKDFFVESDVIVDFRENNSLTEWKKNYDVNKYADLTSMFEINPENITKGNYYAYDYSLSVSKIFTQYFSQGTVQSRYYDPEVASLCYTYYPDRIIYSLPQQIEAIKDSWYVYLINNYKEFKNQISGVKNFAKTGIFITFKDASPLVIQGVDTLQTESGTKITIGDGGLFNQTPQNIVIADSPYEYGSSQNKQGVISTPAGMFYISQNQGKIFSYNQALSEISQRGLKWWFNLFLPYKLLEDFPDYPYQDNPVAGIGCQSIYDNQNSILYFSKKDYRLKPIYKNRVEFDDENKAFVLDGKIRYDIGNPLLFEDASWTVSYDPKNQFWISYHDWHPDLVMPSKITFSTVKNNGIWKHNFVCDTFCNFYGQNYPFEIEVPVVTGVTVTTIKSMEYFLECYKRDSYNCVDQFQVLDFNFDKAVVYNMEQVSGYLNLNVFPKNNVSLSLQYPKQHPGFIIEPNVPPLPGFEILFSKEENKYRFNQFWDITKDRGEFPVGAGYPPQGQLVAGTTELLGNYTQENLWVTQPNGYIKTLNPNNMNINKPFLQRKKFRHYLNFLHLRKDVSGDVNMVLKLTNVKNQISNR